MYVCIYYIYMCVIYYIYVCIYHSNGNTYRPFYVNYLCDFHCINVNNTQFMYMSIFT